MAAMRDVLVIGAGFGGLYALHKLRGGLGFSVQVLEAAPSVGGTWYANRYPGARVDIQSLEYSFSFDDGLQQEWSWSERYAPAEELLRYANHVADRFELRRDIALNTRVEAAHYDETLQGWQITAQDGRRFKARFLILATGPLSAPHLPAITGLHDFNGTVLHSAQWPHEPVDFAERDVAVIGTGSSGVQMIPLLAQQARSLTVFQRTAAYCAPARNGALDREREATIKADYAGFRARNRQMRSGFGSELLPHPSSALAVSDDEREALFEQRWQIGGFGLLGTFPDLMVDLRANELAADFVRRKIRGIVRDPAVAERLCPTHPIGCKRMCVDTGYYETFNRPNVTLVDIAAQPIERFTAHGLRQTDGTEHRFDTLVFATGFDAYTGPLTRIDLRGRGGVRIQDHWRDGPVNYLGLAMAGFPNLFALAGPGSPSAFTNVIVQIEQHVDWIADCLRSMRAQGQHEIEALPEAERRWTEHAAAMADRTVFVHCNSWYVGANIAGKKRVLMALVGGFPAYAQHCEKVAAAGYEGFVLR